MPITMHNMKSFIRWTQSRRTCACIRTPRSVNTFIRTAILCRRNTAVSAGIQIQITDPVIPLSHVLRLVNIILRREFCAFTEATDNLYQHTRRRVSNDSHNQSPSWEPHTSHTHTVQYACPTPLYKLQTTPSARKQSNLQQATFTSRHVG